MDVESCKPKSDLNFSKNDDSPLFSQDEFELEFAINDELVKRCTKQINTRMGSLKKMISNLKTQLQNEKFLWKKEVEAVISSTSNHNMQTKTKSIPLFASPSECSSSFENNLCICNFYYPELEAFDQFDEDRHIVGLSKSEYDLQLVKFHNDVLRARAVKTANFHRHLAIDNYKRKLLEVESMCNLELSRVRQSVQSLQPLQIMVSEWDKCSGDSLTVNNNKECPETPKKIETPLETPRDRSLDHTRTVSPRSDISTVIEVQQI